MKLLEKIRNLPERKKKWIIWMIVLLVAVGLGWWWVRDAAFRLNRLNSQQVEQQLHLNKLKLPHNEAK